MTADLPAAIGWYLTCLDGGRMHEAAESFNLSAIYARPPAGPGGECAPREVFSGRSALRDAFEKRGPRPFRHRVDRAAGTGQVGIFEGTVVSDDGTEGPCFLSSYALDEDGLVRQYLTFTAAGVAGLGACSSAPLSASAVRALTQYFSLLRSAPDEAVGWFGPDAVVSVLIEDGQGLRRATVTEPDAMGEALAACASRSAAWSSTFIDEAGGYMLAEGRGSDDVDASGCTFLASVVLDGEGRVCRHVVAGCGAANILDIPG